MTTSDAAVLTGFFVCGLVASAAQFYQQGSVPIAGSVVLAADGNTALVFTPQPRIFSRSNGIWAAQGTLDAGFDWTTASSYGLSADGHTLVVGTPRDNSGAGAARVFIQNNGVWTQQGAKLVATSASNSAQQGSDVAISGDGNTIAITGPFDNSVGGVWIFTRTNGVWTQQGGKLTGSSSGSRFPTQGTAVALSHDGSTLLLTDSGDANDIGAAWIFARTNGQWAQQGVKLSPSDASGVPQMGASAALSADGNTALIGGPADNTAGAAWVFAKANGNWTQQGPKLVGGGAAGQSAQGASVVLSANGNTALVAGPMDNNGAGALWAFIRSNATWSLLGAKMIAPGTRNLGSTEALSADGSTAVAGGAAIVFFATASAPPSTILTPTTDYADSTGRLGAIAVTVNPPGSTWTVVSSAPWLTVLSPAVGSGNTSVMYSVAPNTSIAARTATITVNGQTMMLIQSGINASFTVSPLQSTLTAAGGTVNLTITTNSVDAPWTAVSTFPWISFATAPSGSGAGPLTVSIAPNSLVKRKGSFTVAGIQANITQEGSGSLTSFNATGSPWSITSGPDGALWFTEQQPKIGRITTAGVVTEYALAAPGLSTVGITAGPDGALWFTASSSNPPLAVIGRMTVAGTNTLYPLPTTTAKPIAINAGPDGALWFTEQNPNRIGRITTFGTITEFALTSDVSAGPSGITSGPDGALWFVSGSYVGRITPAGTISQFPLSRGPGTSIATGPDGALWFGLATTGTSNPGYCGDTFIGRVSTSGHVTVFTLPYPDSSASCSGGSVGILAGPDGAIWVAEDNRAIYRVSTAGVVLAIYPTTATFGITTGPDGALWFTEPTGIGKFPAPASPSGLAFYPLPPCRVLDTRWPAGPFGGPSLAANSSRVVPVLASSCAVPAAAQAYSVNVTVVPSAPLGFLTVWPAGQTLPLVSTLNSTDGAVVANAAIVPAGSNGDINLNASSPTDVVIDITGYFAPPGTLGLAFYPVTPCRVADTRADQMMDVAEVRAFTVSGTCNIPATAQAYSLNITAVPPGPLQYLTLWPTGQQQPWVSTLNSDGRVVANAAIVPAGSNGTVSIFTSDPSHVVMDINGYFAPAGGPSALYFYPLTPCRAADTRTGQGFPAPYGPPSLAANSSRVFLLGYTCGPPPTALAYSLNLTVVPAAPLSYLTAWPLGITQPYVSTLNSPFGRVVANAAIVPAGSNGGISIFVTDQTDLIIDTNGYFAH